MNTSVCAAQCQIERQILQHVKQALRISLGWEVDADDLQQKLSSVRFTAQSFRRHLERIMTLEENDGYLIDVGEAKPNLAQRAAVLHREHDEFRASINDIVPAMEQITPHDAEQFRAACRSLVALLDRLDEHDQRESRLLQEAFCDDEGGEG